VVCQGAYVRIKDGNIELHAPGKVEMNGAQHSFGGPASQSYSLANLPETSPSNMDLLHTYANGEPVAGAAYRATFADGSVRSGVLDSQGRAALTDVPSPSAQVEYFNDPRDIGLEPQQWSKKRAQGPDISALAGRQASKETPTNQG
jgi:type VI secretion system secreted protein VgrG